MKLFLFLLFACGEEQDTASETDTASEEQAQVTYGCVLSN